MGQFGNPPNVCTVAAPMKTEILYAVPMSSVRRELQKIRRERLVRFKFTALGIPRNSTTGWVICAKSWTILSHGWTQLTIKIKVGDQETAQVYFYNAFTKKAQWELPKTSLTLRTV